MKMLRIFSAVFIFLISTSLYATDVLCPPKVTCVCPGGGTSCGKTAYTNCDYAREALWQSPSGGTITTGTYNFVRADWSGGRGHCYYDNTNYLITYSDPPGMLGIGPDHSVWVLQPSRYDHIFICTASREKCSYSCPMCGLQRH